ncbi:hypothetical protein VQZ30_15955 [Microcystis aeruginosa 1339]
MGELIRNLYQQWGVICIELFRSNTPKSLCCKEFSQLVPLSAIAYTSATLQGKKIKDMGIQKYVTRPEKRYKGQRRHSSFYVGQHLYHWLQLHQMFPKNIEELMQISRYWLKDYIKGQRAISLALSTF